MKKRLSRNMRKMLLMAAAMALVLGLAIGGTVAYLVADATQLINTFTVGDINISLTETTGTNYDFVPGDTIAKDPTVGITAGSEACYVFIKVTEANNTVNGLDGKIINWKVDEDNWSALSGHPGYWYTTVDAETAKDGPTFTVFTEGSVGKNGQVTVNTGVTKAMVATINNAKPTITVDAAAVQSDNVGSVTEAWNALPTAFTAPD